MILILMTGIPPNNVIRNGYSKMMKPVMVMTQMTLITSLTILKSARMKNLRTEEVINNGNTGRSVNSRLKMDSWIWNTFRDVWDVNQLMLLKRLSKPLPSLPRTRSDYP